MRLKARLTRLERQVEWLRYWGRIRQAEQQLKLLEMERQIAERPPEHAPARREIVARLKPAPAPPPQALQPLPPPTAPLEARPPPHPSPPQETVVVPFVQPFEPIHNGLVRWRIRGPQDDWDDDDDEEREEEDYDPFADE